MSSALFRASELWHRVSRTAKVILGLVGAAALLSCSSGLQSSNLSIVNQAQAREALVLPQIQRWTLPNGLTVMFLSDMELPLVGGTLFVKGGSLWDKPDAKGALGAMGDQMRQGGAGQLSADQLDRELETLSATISSGFGAELGSIGFSCLESDLDRVWALFADVALRPRFEANRLSLWKGQALEAIRRRADDPEAVAGLALRELLFGETPLGWVTIDQDVQKISPAALRVLHRQFVQPQGAILAVSGRVSAERVAELVRKYFSNWQGDASFRLGPLPEPAPAPQPGIYFISQPLEQATVIIGQPGVARLSPDQYAIDMFNDIFGSGDFSALLTRRVRSELGLAYGIFGGIIPAAVQGKNIIALQTKAETVGLALRQSLGILEQLRTQPPEAGDFEASRSSIGNSFVFNFDSPGKVVGRLAQFEMLGFPANYDQEYLPQIYGLRPEDIQRVAQRRWEPRALVGVVVGNQVAYQNLRELLNNPPPELSGLELRTAQFDQKLRLAR